MKNVFLIEFAPKGTEKFRAIHEVYSHKTMAQYDCQIYRANEPTYDWIVVAYPFNNLSI